MKGTAKRYNKGKLRYELLPVNALEEVVEVYTKGAHKYTVYEDDEQNKIKGSDIPFESLSGKNLTVIDDGANNWKLGQSWLGMMASIKRHIAEWEKGNDYDADPAMNTLHLANATWGLLSLLEYYKIYPQGDDRSHNYLTVPKIGLDIDEVIADFVGSFTERFGLKVPEFWNFNKDFYKLFEQLKDDKEFWLNIKPKINPRELPFEPHCYITSRNIPTEWTELWIQNNGFPTVPVYTVGLGVSKVSTAKNCGIDIFVDDRYENFVELNNAGVCTFLMDAEHNKRYDVGYKRLYHLRDLV